VKNILYITLFTGLLFAIGLNVESVRGQDNKKENEELLKLFRDNGGFSSVLPKESFDISCKIDFFGVCILAVASIATGYIVLVKFAEQPVEVILIDAKEDLKDIERLVRVSLPQRIAWLMTGKGWLWDI
jgi:hypothetical protein